MRPNIEAFFEPVTATVSYVVYDEPGGRAAVIDSVLDFDPKSGRTGTESADRRRNDRRANARDIG